MKQVQNWRSLLGIGLIWGILWAALAMIVGTVIARIDPSDIGPGEEPVALAPIIGLVAFICGVAFAALVATAERGARMPNPPSLRIALWGILVAALVPLLAGKVLPEVLIMIPLGAVSAIVSVAMTRKRVALPAA